MLVSEIMSDDVVTIVVDTPISEAVDIMREHDLTFLPVIHEGVCAGVLTVRDVETRVYAAGLDPDQTRAAQVMSTSLGDAEPHDLGANEAIAAVSEMATIEEAAERMEAFNLHRLAVHDSDYRIVGIVSRSDIDPTRAMHGEPPVPAGAASGAGTPEP